MILVGCCVAPSDVRAALVMPHPWRRDDDVPMKILVWLTPPGCLSVGETEIKVPTLPA